MLNKNNKNNKNNDFPLSMFVFVFMLFIKGGWMFDLIWILMEILVYCAGRGYYPGASLDRKRWEREWKEESDRKRREEEQKGIEYRKAHPYISGDEEVYLYKSYICQIGVNKGVRIPKVRGLYDDPYLHYKYYGPTTYYEYKVNGYKFDPMKSKIKSKADEDQIRLAKEFIERNNKGV